jgi:hypothetical protein
METIRVPRTPAEAFNKDRRVSDLIRAQVNHFKHIEQKLSPEQRRSIPQQGVTTEGEAAQYIAAITAALRPKPAAAASPGPQAVPATSRATSRPVPAEGLAIAAAAAPEAEANAPTKDPLAPAQKKKSKASNGGPGPAPKEKK